jgi:hypothetical protein
MQRNNSLVIRALLHWILQFFKYAFTNSIDKFFTIFIDLVFYKVDNRHYQFFCVCYLLMRTATALAMAAFISAFIITVG